MTADPARDVTGTAGSAAAFLELYDRTMPVVYRYLSRATAGDRALTEDLTQETFMSAIRATRDGDARELTLAYLMVIARNKLIDHHRRQARDERKLSMAWNDTGDRGVSIDADVSPSEATAMLASLPAMQRLALNLRYVDDLPVAEVARLLGRSVHATESLLVRARRSLELAHGEQRNG